MIQEGEIAGRVILLAGEPDERASRIESLAKAGGLPVIRV